MENNQLQNKFNNQEEENIDLRKIFYYFIGNIHWFILSAIVAVGIAYVLTRYATRIYNIYTTVLIEDDTKASSVLSKNVGGSLDLLSGFGMYPSLQNFENQTIILQSYSQVRRTIDKLDFDVSYFSKGRISQTEIYKDAPFEVIFSKSDPQVLGANFQLCIHNDGLMDLKVEGEYKALFNYQKDEYLGQIPFFQYEATIKPGERVKTDYCSFYIKVKNNFNPEADNNYFFIFNSPYQLALSYQGRIKIEPMSKGASMLKISMNDNNPAKAIDFLNQLTKEYLLRNLEKKNELANNTIYFIDSQLDTISKSLNIAETALQTFRSKNKIMDLSFQSQQVFEQLQELENQRMQLDMQNKYYKYLLNYIEKNRDTESVLAPSAMGVQDPLLNQLILEINQLSVTKSSYTNIRKGADLPAMQKIDAQIRNAKSNIYENASNLVKSSNISLQELDRRIKELTANMNNLPETERELFGIKRRFQLNDNLYTYLLERRSEAQIAKASNSPDNEVIDYAMVANHGNPIKPRGRISYIIALMLGLIFPAVIIVLREYFNMKIESPDMVKKITDRPIIGYIPNSGEDAENNIFEGSDTPWAEAFRIVRTKLQFITKNKNNPIIMITSSIPREGKSFVAINLASAIALTGKKTVLVGFDLRRPQLAQRFGFNKNIGLTNYLIGESMLDEIIQKTQDPNLDVIGSGIIPPNPAELIAEEKTTTFLNIIKNRYDFIIMDTAPMSPVSDSHYLSKLADATIFVVRDKYTNKQVLEATIEEANSLKIENLFILMNDIKLSHKGYGSSYGYKYGYKYGYRYGYGYGETQGKKKGK